MSIFKTLGLKRRLASLLLSLAGVVSQIPGFETYGKLLTEAAGILGGGGLLHALLSGNLGKFKLASFVSLLASLLAIAPTVPALAPYQHILQSILTILGLFGYAVKKK